MISKYTTVLFMIWKLLVLINTNTYFIFQNPKDHFSDVKKEETTISNIAKAEALLQSWPQKLTQEAKKIESVKRKRRVQKNKQIVLKEEKESDLTSTCPSSHTHIDEKVKIVATKKKHEAGQMFSGKREVVENLNISEDSGDSEDEDNNEKKAKSNPTVQNKSSKNISSYTKYKGDKCKSSEDRNLKTESSNSNKQSKSSRRKKMSDDSDSDFTSVDDDICERKRASGRRKSKVNYCDKKDSETDISD